MSAELEPMVKPVIIPPVITIDGPSGSGKGTIAHRLALKLGFHVLDSGALYRLLALAAQQHGVQTDNEAALYFDAVLLDAFHVCQQIAVLVLDLFALSQAGVVRSFNADEDPGEAGCDHRLHQGHVFGQVDGRFRVKGHAFFVLSPGDERG